MYSGYYNVRTDQIDTIKSIAAFLFDVTFNLIRFVRHSFIKHTTLQSLVDFYLSSKC